jgi:gamma-glutamyltranspeptidase/glutathione hydrolase
MRVAARPALRHTAAIAVALLSACGPAAAPAPTPVPDAGKRLVAEHGVVAAGNSYAAEAGVEMLRQGGNAVDAAVAATFAIGVVEPMMSGIGAGGGMLLWMQKTGRAVAGLLAAHERYGRLPRAAVLAPAIRLAADGFVANSILAREAASDTLKLQHTDGARRIFLPNGKPVRVGARIVQPELAATLRRIAAEGRDGFYRGPVAAEIVRTLAAEGNLVTLDDFARYAPRWKRPLCTTYRGRAVLSAPAPQSGVQVLETLNLLEPHALPSLGAPHRSVAAFRVLAGALRASVTDRESYVGDPDRVAVPQAGLASKAFAASRATTMLDSAPRPTIATLVAGDPWPADRAAAPDRACAPFTPVGPASTAPRTEALGNPDDGAHAETTHLSVVDAEGNAVSLTNTNGLGFGTGTWAAGAFFNSALLNFSRNPASPNAIGPWRVPSSTIAPTLVLEGGRVRMVVGSPGSQAIPPAIVETIVYTLDYGLDPLAALRVPRVIPTSGARLQLEDGFAEPVLDAARRQGFDLATSPPMDMSFGGVHVIARVGKRWVGAADPRRDGEVRGY